MKNCKKIFVDKKTTVDTIIRNTDFSLSEASTFQASVKNGTLIIKPIVTAFHAEMLAGAFLMDHRNFAQCPHFEINHHQRVVACAAGNHVGVAYCSKEDNFSVIIGKALALSRALREPLPPLLQTYLDLD